MKCKLNNEILLIQQYCFLVLAGEGMENNNIRNLNSNNKP